MCGRFTQTANWAEVWAFSQPLRLTLPEAAPEPRWNIAPSTAAWVLGADGRGGAKAGRMRWGLVSHWAEDAKASFHTINARIETAASKPTFRDAWRRRRCLVPATGYYEWVTDAKGRKQPFYLSAADAPLLMFAGLWDRWTAPDGEPLLSFSIVTEAAEGPMAALHHRRPLMLQPPTFADWLQAPAEALDAVLAATQRPAMRWHAVGPAVGNPRNEGPTLIEPAAAPDK
jgi:putative SOS response-associated peptidase YedK